MTKTDRFGGRAAMVREPQGANEIIDVDLVTPLPTEVVVRVVATGVCHTDAVVRAGDYPVPMPIVLGHEGAGIVVAIGEAVTDVAVGDHVVMSLVACGVCSTCLARRPALCQHAYEQNFLGVREDGGTTLRARVDGSEIQGRFFGQSSFAEYALCPERSLVVVPKDADLRIAGPLGCGIQTGAGAVLNSLRPEPGSSIAIFGVGAVGLSAVMAARVAECATIVAIDRHERRLLIAEELGATHMLLGDDPDLLQKLRHIGGDGIEYAIDTTGNPKVVRTAIDALRVAGTFGLVGAAKFGTEVSLDLTHMLFGRVFRGIIEGDSVPREFIPRLLQLHAEGRFPFDRLIEFFPLDAIEEAIESSERGAVIKPVLLMHPERP